MKKIPVSVIGQADTLHENLPEQNRVNPKVRVTGILVEDGFLLVVKQSLRERSNWTLPGGTVEYGETLQESLIREMKEETGLDVAVGDLLYVCDRFKSLKNHVIDMSFCVERISDISSLKPGVSTDGEAITQTQMVQFKELTSYGFSQKFVNLITEGFPAKGSYQGDFHAFYA